jgi:hypothetical protein
MQLQSSRPTCGLETGRNEMARQRDLPELFFWVGRSDADAV